MKPFWRKKFVKGGLFLFLCKVKTNKKMNKFTKAIAAIMLIVAAIIVAGCNKPDEPNNGGNNNSQNDTIFDLCGTLNGHEWVNLGLPSGTLWASCNVGATLPEEYGDYYSWGETQIKEVYNYWSNYKYCNVQSEPFGDCFQLTKYCNSETYGFNDYTDDLTILLPCDDAATANWGNGWRMPTMGEWMELYQNTICTWVTQNGVNGMRFTSSNGQNLFLPAAYCYTTEFNFIGRYGMYWSSSLRTEYPVCATDFDFSSSRYGLNYYDCNRCGGMPVRPVCKAK